MTRYRDQLNAGQFAPTDQEEDPNVKTASKRTVKRRRSSTKSETPTPTPDPVPAPDTDDDNGDDDAEE